MSKLAQFAGQKHPQKPWGNMLSLKTLKFLQLILWHIRCSKHERKGLKWFFESLLSCALRHSLKGKARGRGEKAALVKPVGTGRRWRSSDVLTLPKFLA